ncbi:MAG TPA: hypothetical protein DCX25_02455 [Candidatus Pacebacteria bacterium]|nr:hypothetical protein [Candidatus Paceibacterota bacterium]HCR93257.1 hypothetical protein [Candidatus Paceibacterota bacterium]
MKKIIMSSAIIIAVLVAMIIWQTGIPVFLVWKNLEIFKVSDRYKALINRPSLRFASREVVVDVDGIKLYNKTLIETVLLFSRPHKFLSSGTSLDLLFGFEAKDHAGKIQKYAFWVSHSRCTNINSIALYPRLPNKIKSLNLYNLGLVMNSFSSDLSKLNFLPKEGTSCNLYKQLQPVILEEIENYFQGKDESKKLKIIDLRNKILVETMYEGGDLQR